VYPWFYLSFHLMMFCSRGKNFSPECYSLWHLALTIHPSIHPPYIRHPWIWRSVASITSQFYPFHLSYPYHWRVVRSVDRAGHWSASSSSFGLFDCTTCQDSPPHAEFVVLDLFALLFPTTLTILPASLDCRYSREGNYLLRTHDETANEG